MEDYKVYIDRKYGNIPAGVYPVVDSNETYDHAPTRVTIEFCGEKEIIPVSRYDWGIFSTPGQIVYDEDILVVLKQADDGDENYARENLDGLRHCDYTVDEFIQEFGNGDAKAALRIAIRADFDAMPIPKKQMNKALMVALTKLM